MPIPLAAGALIAGGMAAQGAGSYFGAQSENRAARDARGFYDKRTGEGAQRQAFPFFGGDTFADWYMGGLDPRRVAEDKWFSQRGITPEMIPAAQQRFTDAIGGPIYDQMRGLSDQARSQVAGLAPALQQDFARVQQLAQQLYGGAGRAGQGAFQQAAGAVDPLYLGMEEAAREFGRGREKTIREDSARTLKDLNARTSASLAGMGANTFGANAMRANAADVNLGQQRALSEVADHATQLFMGARGARGAMQQNLLGQGAGARANAAAMGAGFGSQNAQRQAETMGQLRASTIGQDFQLGSLPLQAVMQLMGSSAQNPWLGQNTSQYSPGASPGGSALQNVGGGLSLLGGYGLMNGWGSSGGGGSGRTMVPAGRGGFTVI